MALTWKRSVEWDSEEWRKLAACRHIDPDLFFPVGMTGPAIEQIEAAKRVCDACEVSEPCLEFALESNQESGVWGGTSEEERRKLRRVWLAARRRTTGVVPSPSAIPVVLEMRRRSDVGGVGPLTGATAEERASLEPTPVQETCSCPPSLP